MAPRRGTKRKANGAAVALDGAPKMMTPADRETWPGWVEIESDPALFNVMLQDMGVRGVKVQELYSVDDEMLAILPHPVHALIFLFKYRAADETTNGATDCPDDVWFANQIPDFACATVALINIINNIPGLKMGRELEKFRESTWAMDPMSRGDAIDTFDFVRRIHNSFAGDTEIMNADMHLKTKLDRLKRKQSAQKANATKAAKKAAQAMSPEDPVNELITARRTTRKPARRASDAASALEVAIQDTSPDADYKDRDEVVGSSEVRRSGRRPKPRLDLKPEDNGDDKDDEAGFHFIAYMPIHGHVWRMDGLDYFPQDLGTFGDGDWLHMAQESLMVRMAQYEGADAFNLMAVVHDPAEDERLALLRNIRAIRLVEDKLRGTANDWRAAAGISGDGAAISGPRIDLDISDEDIANADMDATMRERVDQESDASRLLELRQDLLGHQAPLRALVRDAILADARDREEARHRRHDYGPFVRAWLGALATAELLEELIQ